jgi:hypothetical protein
MENKTTKGVEIFLEYSMTTVEVRTKKCVDILDEGRCCMPINSCSHRMSDAAKMKPTETANIPGIDLCKPE